jgi:hypothetical protein
MLFTLAQCQGLKVLRAAFLFRLAAVATGAFHLPPVPALSKLASNR